MTQTAFLLLLSSSLLNQSTSSFQHGKKLSKDYRTKVRNTIKYVYSISNRMELTPILFGIGLLDIDTDRLQT